MCNRENKFYSFNLFICHGGLDKFQLSASYTIKKQEKDYLDNGILLSLPNIFLPLV